jgi:hypothetical protein
VEAKAEAKTDAIFDAAAALLDAEPRRARPSSRRAEEDKARPTASKLPPATRRHGTRCSTCSRATANIRCPPHGLRAELLKVGAFAGSRPCRAAPLQHCCERPRRGTSRHGGRWLRNRPASLFYSFSLCSTELVGASPSAFSHVRASERPSCQGLVSILHVATLSPGRRRYSHIHMQVRV